MPSYGSNGRGIDSGGSTREAVGETLPLFLFAIFILVPYGHIAIMMVSMKFPLHHSGFRNMAGQNPEKPVSEPSKRLRIRWPHYLILFVSAVTLAIVWYEAIETKQENEKQAIVEKERKALNIGERNVMKATVARRFIREEISLREAITACAEINGIEQETAETIKQNDEEIISHIKQMTLLEKGPDAAKKIGEELARELEKILNP